MRYVLAALLVVAGANAAAARADVGAPAVTVKVQAVDSAPTYDYSVDRATLTRKNGDAYHVVNGTTEARYRLDIKSQFVIVRQRRQACIRGVQLSAVVGFERPVVHVAREYRAGTCEHNAVLAHENRHVKAFAESGREALRRAKMVLSDEANRMIGMCAAESDTVTAAGQARLNRIVEALGMDARNANQRRQAEIDTPEEYARVARQCGRR